MLLFDILFDLIGCVSVAKSIVEEGRGNTNSADLVVQRNDSIALFACFLCGPRSLCMFGCVCRLYSSWFCADLVCKISSGCCCTLPAVVSHLPECDAECLQHLALHSTT